MSQLALCILLTSLLVNGIEIATQQNMILHFVRRWLDKVFISHPAFTQKELERAEQKLKEQGMNLDEIALKYGNTTKTTILQPKISKLYYPILYCIKCMPSVYGTAICLIFLPFTWHLLYAIPVVVLCSVALASIIHTQYL